MFDSRALGLVDVWFWGLLVSHLLTKGSGKKKQQCEITWRKTEWIIKTMHLIVDWWILERAQGGTQNKMHKVRVSDRWDRSTSSQGMFQHMLILPIPIICIYIYIYIILYYKYIYISYIVYIIYHIYIYIHTYIYIYNLYIYIQYDSTEFEDLTTQEDTMKPARSSHLKLAMDGEAREAFEQAATEAPCLLA